MEIKYSWGLKLEEIVVNEKGEPLTFYKSVYDNIFYSISYKPKNYFLSKDKKDVYYLKKFKKHIYEKDIEYEKYLDNIEINIIDMLSFEVYVENNVGDFNLTHEYNGYAYESGISEDYPLLFEHYPYLNSIIYTGKEKHKNYFKFQIEIPKRVVRLRFDDFF